MKRPGVATGSDKADTDLLFGHGGASFCDGAYQSTADRHRTSRENGRLLISHRWLDVRKWHVATGT